MALKPYESSIPSPISERWRWRNFPEVQGLNFADFTEDDNGVIWGAFNNPQKYLYSFDGYEWTCHTSEEEKKMPVGLIKTIETFDGAILIGGTNGLLSYQDGKFEYLLKTKPKEFQISVQAITIIGKNAFMASTNHGLFYYKSGKKFFYTKENLVAKAQSLFPNVKCMGIDPQIYEGGIRKDFFINTITKYKGDSLWMFAQTKNHRTIVIEKTKNENNPLSFRDERNYKGNPQFGLQVESLNTSDRLWVVSSSAYRPVCTFDGQRWENIYLAKGFGGNDEHYAITEMDDDHLLISGNGSILDFYKGKWNKYTHKNIPVAFSAELKLLKTKDGNLWVGSSQGQVYFVEYNRKRNESYHDLIFQTASEDGTKWFISKDGEVVKNKNGKWFVYDQTDGLIENPNSLMITSRGDIWCSGSHQSAAAVAYLKDGNWYKQLFDSLALSASPNALFEDKDESLWLGADSKNRLPKKGGVVKISYQDLDSISFTQFQLPRNILGGFTYDPKGVLVAFSNFAAFKFSEKNDWEKYPLNILRISSSYQMPNGDLWLGTLSSGLFKWDKKGIRKQYQSVNFKTNNIVDIHFANDRLWVATEKGNHCFYKGEWVYNVLPKDWTIYHKGGGFREDNNGNLWINIHATSWTNQVFNDSEFDENYRFLTIKHLSDTVPPVVKIKQYAPQIDQSGNAIITWEGKDFMHHTPKDKLLYSYRLSDGEWSEYSTETSATFFSLEHGNHLFEVRCMDSDFNRSVENAKVSFVVLPPVYKQVWFISLISSLVGIILYLFLKTLKKNRELSVLNQNLVETNLLLKESQDEIIRQKDEIHQSKLRFFTNISHEFRTPLTLLIGPIQQLKRRYNDDLFALLERNANILLKLVNEIMDFRKLETGHMSLSASETDIVTFCDEILMTFKSLAEDKNIELRLLDQTTESMVWLDREKFTKVMFNLLSNALKFTSKGGNVSVIITNEDVSSDRQIIIRIEDTGIGISDEAIQNIFGRFYQENKKEKRLGSGIGLALSKELVLLHHGDISVDSKEGKGTAFTIRLPLGNQHFKHNEINKIQTEESDSKILYPERELTSDIKMDKINMPLHPNSSKQILLVDDNEDILDYLKSILSSEYQIEFASDGIEGWQKAIESQPNLIISDVMMPNMNGIEFCTKLKTDIQTSHIPVVLLTARSSTDHKIEGLQTGADLYISKPFEIDILKLQIQNIFHNQEKSIQKLQERHIFIPTDVSENKTDQSFIEDIIQKIKLNISDSEFKVDALSKELGMTTRNLHLKLKSLTGFTPGEFLRNIRLETAAKIIKTSKLTVAEVAYQTGFTNPSHFNKVFKAKYQMTPVQYRQEHVKTADQL
ncbi:hybrid sensor histidine kinase/response regulator transcription factor [Sediminitomix flava]|uniref:hybrid sensor histidine kinase/response regulator transcription factor n=1 Tax=Sediminitomix flava TaxID=379075 RepID=UPI001304C2B8|nr:ATP-binding protein [Sediminitomix flava]